MHRLPKKEHMFTKDKILFTGHRPTAVKPYVKGVRRPFSMAFVPCCEAVTSLRGVENAENIVLQASLHQLFPHFPTL
jgi:hypothetical protein